MTSPSFGDIPDSLLIDILSRASGISQQQEQQQEHQAQQDQAQARAESTRQQQRHLCGIFTRIDHRWRLAALSICRGLDVSLKDLSAVKQLSSWLQRNGNQLQHLSLDLSTSKVPASFFSIIPSSTRQLQSLKLRGLAHLSSDISADEAAAWGGLTRLTRLDVEDVQRFGAPMQYLDSVEELSVSASWGYDLAEGACKAVQSKLPRLRVLRVQDLCTYGRRFLEPVDRPGLDILAGKLQLHQVEGMAVYGEDLNHAAVGLFYPCLEIVVDRSIELVDAWLQNGGGMKLVNLVLCGRSQPCGSVLAKLQGLPLLRGLKLSSVVLGAGAQGLQQLTQITRLDLLSCSPVLTSLAQLPPQLLELSMDNYAGQLQQQPQHGVATNCLQHLSSLALSGDIVSDAAMRDFSTLPQLQKLCLMETADITFPGGLACLSALQRLTSLTMHSIETAGMQLADLSVLSSFTSLQHFAVTLPMPALAALCLVKPLAQVSAFDMAVDWGPKWRDVEVEKISGGPQEVRLGMYWCPWVCTDCML